MIHSLTFINNVYKTLGFVVFVTFVVSSQVQDGAPFFFLG